MHFKALLKEDPWWELISPRRLQVRWERVRMRGCFVLKTPLGTPGCSGLLVENPQGPFRNPSCPGLSGACAAVLGSATGGAPAFRRAGVLSEGQRDGIPTA